MKPFTHAVPVISLIIAAAVGQDREREVTSFDGHPRESVAVEGRATWLHDPAQVSGGCGALRITPSPKRRFYGVTVRGLRASQPRAIRLSVFNEAQQPEQWIVRMQRFEANATKRKGLPSATSNHMLAPGWSELELDLTHVVGGPDKRQIDMSNGIGSFRISRRKRRDDDAGLRVDRLRFVGEASPATIRRRLAAALKSEDFFERRRSIRSILMLLPDTARVTAAVKLLKSPEALPSTRRAARDALASVAEDSAVGAVIAELGRARAPLRLELLWALSSMPSRVAREESIRRASAPTTATPDRVALLQAMGRRHAIDVAPLLKRIPPKRPWPERAALISALRTCATANAIDALIAILKEPGSVRAADDAASALTRLSGKDLGPSASAWDAWWKVNRGSAALNDTGARPKMEYATYYGIPVPNGRVAFVIDLSGSMKEPVSGGRAQEHIKRAPHLKELEIKRRLDLAKEELIHVVKGLQPEAWLTVIAYGDSAQPIVTTKGLQRVTKSLQDKLSRRVRALSPSGKTNIHDGLFRAFHPDRKPSKSDVARGPDTVFLLTDGNPSTGTHTSRIELRDAVLQWNLGRMIRIHSVNVGASQSRWLRQLAAATDGQFLDLTSDPDRSDQGR
ncbi:MAG: VWA domain-containing protein [Planctomycetota bacterium]|nr:VWA domain-containing protein [Planctomycetota bacterium]